MNTTARCSTQGNVAERVLIRIVFILMMLLPGGGPNASSSAWAGECLLATVGNGVRGVGMIRLRLAAFHSTVRARRNQQRATAGRNVWQTVGGHRKIVVLQMSFLPSTTYRMTREDAPRSFARSPP